MYSFSCVTVYSESKETGKRKVGLFGRFRKFMYGRNGNDRLNRFLIFVALGLMLFSFFFGIFRLTALYFSVYLLEWMILFRVFFRFFSKNIRKRRGEEEKFLRLKKRFSGFFSLKKAEWRDRKTHIYRRCPGCKEMLRLPRREGHHTVKCCRCGHRFEIDVK